MSGFLKQSTAVTIKFGPFLDATDGVTPETGLAGGGTEISKAGGAYASGPTLGTHDAEGEYPLALTSGNTDTVGLLKIKSFDGSVHCPVWVEYQVIEEAVYDALFAASALGYVANAPVNVAQFGGSNGTFSSGRPEVNTTHVGGTAQTARDLGAGVLISPGTGTGEISVTSGVIASNLTQIGGDAQSATDLKDFTDAGYDPATNKVQGVVLVDLTTDLTTKTGFALTQTFPSNFSAMVINATGGVAPDWGNIQDPGAAVDLTQTSILQVQDQVSVSDLDATAVTQIWSNVTRTLTAGTNIALTKGVGLLGLNDIAATDVVSGGAINTNGGAVSTVTTVTNAVTPDAAAVRNAIGLASANLDAQLAALDTLLDSILADTGTDGVALSAAVRNQIADAIIRRTLTNVKASSDGDALSQRSLYGALNMMFRSSISGTTQTVSDVDGTTLGTFTLTLGSGGEITSIVFAS
jgi:hypothetical protein